MFKPILDQQDLGDAIIASDDQPVLIFKHSNRCELSARANINLRLLTQEADPLMYRVVVHDARPVSNQIEQLFGIRHESPQVILLWKRQPVFNASHRKITAENVRHALAVHTLPTPAQTAA